MNVLRIAAIVLTLTLPTGAARGDVVAVVSSKSAVTTLSRNQLVDIFLGKSARFPDGSQAVPIDQAEGSAARDEFYGRVAGRSAAQIKAHWSKFIFTGRGQPPRAAANSNVTKKLLAANPHAIAYIERSAADSSVRIVRVVSSGASE